MLVALTSHLLLASHLAGFLPLEGGPPSGTWSKALVAGDIPGISVAKVEAGSLKWNDALGRRKASDRSKNAAPVDPETAFEAASLGKPIVAIAILSLVDSGNLDLDQKANSIVDLQGLRDLRRSEITIRMLLSHSSGLSFNQPLLESKPGSRFSYSTLGFRYLQQIAEKKLGASLEDWANRTLFQPLLMKRSSFVYSARFADNRAEGVNWLLRRQSQMTSAAGTGAFDLITCATDYARLWAAVLEGKVLREGSLRAMFTPQVRITGEFSDPSVAKRSRSELAAGLGILLQRQGRRWIGFQWGDNGGSSSLLLADPAKRDALVFFTNAQDGLHSAEALARIGGMRDAGVSWVGYEQVSTAYRKAWKRITLALDRDIEAGVQEFRQMTVKDPKTANKVARNLGYFNLFRGDTIAAEPFFRVASTTDSADASMLQGWTKCLVLTGKVAEAVSVQARAFRMDPSLAKTASLADWLRAAEADLKEEVKLAPAPSLPTGEYGSYKLELDSDGHLFLVSNTGRRPLALLRSGGFLSRDLAYRVELKDDKALITLAGEKTETLTRSKT
ncbi:MAG: serine hydrolase domain-containing protein [Fimbriimonas sp.]